KRIRRRDSGRNWIGRPAAAGRNEAVESDGHGAEPPKRNRLANVGALRRDGGLFLAFLLSPADTERACAHHTPGSGVGRRTIRKHRLLFLRRVFHRKPTLGVDIGLHRLARRHAHRGSHLERGERFARLDVGLSWFCRGAFAAGSGGRRDFSGRPEDGGGIASRYETSSRHRAILQRRNTGCARCFLWRSPAWFEIRLAHGVCDYGVVRRRLARTLGDRRPAAISSENREEGGEAHLPESFRAAIVGSGVQLFFA